MPDLPDVNQTFDANAAPFLAAVDAMIAALDNLVAKTADVRTAMMEMAAVAEAAAGVVDAAMGSAARSTQEVASAARDAAASNVELAAILRMLTFATDSAEASEMHLSEITETLGIIQKNTADSALSLMLVEQLLGQILERTGASARSTAGDLALLAAAEALLGKNTDAAGASAARNIGWFRLTGNAIHWIVMGTLEIAATAIPALVALGAAALAMAPTFTHIADQMNYLRAATGSWSGVLANSVPVLQAAGASMVRMRQAVAPDAYVIFGAAINSLIGHVGAFSGVTQQAANVLAQFASKLSAELAGPLGSQLAGFFANAVRYMIQWGQVLGNLGHAFINIVGGMHGVGQLLLDALVGISHALEAITAVPFVAWIIGALAAMSALYRYSKLLQTAFTWLGGSALISGIKTLVATIQTLYGVFKLAGGGAAGFEAVLTNIPLLLGPAGMAVLAFGVILAGLAISGKNAADATDNLISAQNKLPPTITNLNNGMASMGKNLVDLTQSYARLNTSQLQTASVQTRLDGSYRAGSAAANQYNSDVTKTINEMKNLANQTINLITGMTQAGMRTGQVGAAMQAMAVQTAIADSKIQSVNQAFDQYVQILTGATSGNANFITSLANIGSVAATTSNNLGTATGQMSLNATQFSKALTQMGTTGAAAWQNFDQVVSGSIQPLIDNLRLMGTTGALTGRQVQQAMIDMVVSTAKWAGGNKAAQSILMSMLNQVGLAPSNFAKFVASQQKAGAGQHQLNGIIMQGTIAFSKLSQMAQNAAKAMNPMVAQAIDTAALSSSGFNAKLAKLQTDMMNHQPRAVIVSDMAGVNAAYQTAMQIAEQSGQGISTSGSRTASAVHSSTTSMGTYWSNAKGKQKDLENQVQMSSAAIGAHSHSAASQVQSAMTLMENAMNTAKARAQALQSEIDSLHGKTITVTTVFNTVGAPPAYGVPGVSNVTVKKPAAGGYITGAGTSTSDSIPAWLSNGEFVMRASAVKHYGVGFLHALNSQRLAGGGPSGPPVPGVSPHLGGWFGPPPVLHSHIRIELDGKQIGTALRTEILTYNRRNTSSNVSLRNR